MVRIVNACVLLGLLALAVPASACAPATASGPHLDPRVEAAAARGLTRVLVELRIPGGVTPEGNLPSAEGVTAQRQAIAAAQAGVLARLRGTEHRVVRRFESTPFLALEIGPSALAALRAMGNIVTRVVPDAVSPPTGGSNPKH